jgi:putative ABC transport system permease protein
MRDHRLLKIWRDLVRQRARSLWVLLALVAGLTGSGVVLHTWAWVQRATAQGYLASQPVSVTLTLAQGLDAPALARLTLPPGWAGLRARRELAVQLQVEGVWRRGLLVAVNDFEQQALGRLQPVQGDWPPRAGGLWIEQSSLAFSGAQLGQPVTVAGPGSLTLPLRGVLRDVALAPGWMEHLVYAFASPDTLAGLGAAPGFDQLQLRLRDAQADRAQVRQAAEALRQQLQAQGLAVRKLDVPEPNQHVHAAQMDSLLMTQGAFALLALGVCGFLVLNLVAAQLAGQTRQIGVMKALGAAPRQLAALYLGQALALGAAACALALPLSIALARPYAGLKAELLNLPLDGVALPLWAPALQLLLGLLLPPLAAALPVRQACTQAVGAALRSAAPPAPAGLAARSRDSRLPRPLLLALGNALRRRQRTGLTVLSLALAAAVLMGAANLRRAVQGSVDQLFAAQHFQLSLRLSQPAPAAPLEALAQGVAGVQAAEAWRSRELRGPAQEPLRVLGLRPGGLLQPLALQGRWLRPGDTGLVVNRALQRQQPALQVGAELQLDGRSWRVLGLVDTGPQALAYTDRATLDALAGNREASLLAVALRPGSAALQLDTVQRLRDALQAAEAPVASSQMQAETRRVVEDHLLMVVEFLAAMGWLMAAVGGLGLASTLGLAVLERGREIGVLRALGARSRDLFAMVQAEGLLMAAAAWLLALPLSVAASAVLGQAFGRVMFAVPLSPWPVLPQALATGLGMLLLAALAGLGAARQAVRVPVARVLGAE